MSMVCSNFIFDCDSQLVFLILGTNRHEKRIIGSKMCGALLERIKDVLAATTRQKDESSHSHNLHDDHGMSYVLDHSHARDLDIESLG